MNREESLHELETVLHMIELFTWKNEGLGNYTKEQCQEICNRYKKAHDYIKENLK